MTRAASAIVFKPDHHMVVISAWPKPDGWMQDLVAAALQDDRVRDRLDEARCGNPVVATILPPLYGMRGMYYTRSDPSLIIQYFSFRELGRIALRHLLPVKGFGRENSMGIDPDTDYIAVEIVFSRAEKPYKSTLTLAESLEAGVRTTPLVVASVWPSTKRVSGVFVPLEQNVWGLQVVMSFL